MKRINKETYLAERGRAIVTLFHAARKFRAYLDEMTTWAADADANDAAILQAYTAAETALLALMKEESEETNHE